MTGHSPGKTSSHSTGKIDWCPGELFLNLALMKIRILQILGLASAFALASSIPAQAEQHRATHLGNPATRFAPPLTSPDDLRALFGKRTLRPDIAAILGQWGWKGNLDDLLGAAATNEITEFPIAVGTSMPFMASRDNGEPVCLRNVLWAGKAPVSALAFTFTSNDRRYRCVTPKPCSNFYVEDLGPVPKPGLALDCSVPEKVPVNRPVHVCLTVRNTGNAAEPRTVVSLAVPPGATVTSTTEGAAVAPDHLTWEISNLAPAASAQRCATFVAQQIGGLSFNASASGLIATSVQSACATEIFGISAILLEKADDPDPVGTGSNTVYTVKVTNQGTADDANVQVVVTIAPELAPVSASEGTIASQTVTLPIVPRLAPKQAVTWTIVARGISAGDGHTRFTLSSDVLKSPIMAEESTTVY
jgi:uncharacterized repeat protein (TIGR01451 family)